MRRTMLAITALALSCSVSATEYTLDPNHTFPNFTINHLGFSTMHGRFNKTEGKMVYDPANQTGSVEIVIDASSIDTGHAKRDEHLQSPDFLNAVEFPEITFKSTTVEFDDGNLAKVTGDLTILGVSKSVVLDVTNAHCGEHPFNQKLMCGFDANTTIKRSDFGVSYGLPAIGDEMTLMFEVEAYKN
jgi:polyisoprenoid-binding protein YceI